MLALLADQLAVGDELAQVLLIGPGRSAEALVVFFDLRTMVSARLPL